MPKGGTKYERKRKRGQQDQNSGACDLFVELPSKVEEPVQLVLDGILSRLEDTRYRTVALTHTVYGRPRHPEDVAENVLPLSLWQQRLQNRPGGINVLRRLHIVVESKTDLSIFSNLFENHAATGDKVSSLLRDYDLISVSPRNDAVFTELCTATKSVDIISLDYNSARGGLPFVIRSSDVQSAVSCGVIFEISYAPAVLHKASRKALVQTCRQLATASLGTKVKIMVSSGSRILEERDLGALALRQPEDITNLGVTVMGFDGRVANGLNGSTCRFALEQARRRRLGNSASIVHNVYVASSDEKSEAPQSFKDEGRASHMDEGNPKAFEEADSGKKEETTDTKEVVVEDGFISF